MISLLAESWTWYAFATLVVLCRFISRWLQLGSVKRYQIEDYVMLFVFAFYTNLIVCMNIVANLDTNLMQPGDIPQLTPASIQSRIHGSKLVLVVEQSMIATIWGCKICLLLLYNKLTFGLKQQIAVKVLGGYVIGGWILMETLYFAVWCRPFHQYWAVPTDNIQCSAAIHHLITNAVLNISSDLMMLSIPLPLLITSQLPRAKKLILCCLFGLGIFVILCAVLNKYYSFVHPFSPMWTYWYIREASTAIFVANMPMCWALMRRLFNLRAFHNSPSSQFNLSTAPPTIGGGMPHGRETASINGIGDSKNDARTGTSWWDREGRGNSEEYIVAPSRAKTKLEIWESKEFDVVNDKTSSVHSNDYGLRPDTMFDGEAQTKTVVTARTSESSFRGV